MTIKCVEPSCDRTHRDGFRMSKSRDGWRCQEHRHSPKDQQLINRMLRRPLTGREVMRDDSETIGGLK